MHPFSQLPLILVSGQARSGTTVLTKAIGMHPEVYSNMKESNFLVDTVWAVKRACKMEARRTQLVVSESEFRATYKDALWRVLFPDDGWNSTGVPKGVSTFSSMRSEVAEFLIEFLPDVRILNIVRNGVEVVASRMAHANIGKRSFDEHCVAWSAAMDMISWGADYPEHFHLVRHHHLLQSESAQQSFDEIQRWLGLTHSPHCVEFVQGGIINTTRSESDTDQTATDLSTRGDRWKSWESSQRDAFERICGGAMQQLGYAIPWA